MKLIEVPAELKLLRDQYWQLSKANHVHYLRYLLGTLIYAERAESLEELTMTQMIATEKITLVNSQKKIAEVEMVSRAEERERKS